MDKKVVIYTSLACKHCHEAMDYLRSMRVPFIEKSVSLDEAAKQELFDRGFMGVPVIYVGDEFMVGFDRKKLAEMLK